MKDATAYSAESEQTLLFELRIPVPGYARDQLEVRVQDELLIIRGERSQPLTDVQAYHVLEAYAFDSFERSYRLGAHLCREGIRARLEEEVLHLAVYDIPKADEHSDKKVRIR